MADLQISFIHVPTQRKVTFTAFLENFNDSVDGEWSTEKVFGRMDPIVQYKGTTRKINCGFTVPSDSHEEAFTNHKKIAALMNFMYPAYELTSQMQVYTIAAPPLMKVKFNNLIRSQTNKSEGLLGYIPTIKYEPDMNSNIFVFNSSTVDVAEVKRRFRYDIDPASFSRDPNRIGFQSFKISFDLTVLHAHRMGWNLGTKDAAVEDFPHGIKRPANPLF